MGFVVESGSCQTELQAVNRSSVYGLIRDVTPGSMNPGLLVFLGITLTDLSDCTDSIQNPGISPYDAVQKGLRITPILFDPDSDSDPDPEEI